MLQEILAKSAAGHKQLCPRQVLGARMGLLGGRLLGLDLPRADKRLLVIVETDGCAVDGIAAATGCAVGRRTLRIQDYGKVAATLVDVDTARAVRLVPRLESRTLARSYAPGTTNRWEAQLYGYQVMPDDLLFSWEWVELTIPVDKIEGEMGVRVICEVCQEEIINGREIMRNGIAFCRTCAGEAYYRQLDEHPAPVRLTVAPYPVPKVTHR